MSSQVLLCVDDRLPFLQLRKDRLELLGYSILTSSSSSSAITVLEQRAVTAVILEYKSEGMDAEAVAFHIKQHFPRQPIILLSAYSEMPGRLLWLVDEFLMKSEPLEHLRDIIRKLPFSTEGLSARSKSAPKSLPVAS